MGKAGKAAVYGAAGNGRTAGNLMLTYVRILETIINAQSGGGNRRRQANRILERSANACAGARWSLPCACRMGVRSRIRVDTRGPTRRRGTSRARRCGPAERVATAPGRAPNSRLGARTGKSFYQYAKLPLVMEQYRTNILKSFGPFGFEARARHENDSGSAATSVGRPGELSEPAAMA